jgi:hypothetical protein
MVKVFLGGTCNRSTWRNELITMLTCDYFNPVVDDWTEDCIDEEYRQKLICDYQLFVITPDTIGCFSIAELIDASNKIPDKTLCALLGNWNANNIMAKRFISFSECLKIAEKNGAIRFYSLENIATFLNNI